MEESEDVRRPWAGFALFEIPGAYFVYVLLELLSSPVLLEDSSASRYLPGIASSLRVLCAVFPPTPGPSRQHAWRVPTTSPKL